MDGTTLQKIRDILLDRRNQIGRGRIRELNLAADSDIGANHAEIIDIAQALEQLDRDQSLADQERREMIAVERALAKMATGHFGICEDCEEEIPDRRLMVLPAARLCANCQALEEKHNRSRGPSVAAAR